MRRNSRPCSNTAQAMMVRTLLKELYQHESKGGDWIQPGDVMIIGSYKDKRRPVKTLFEERIRYDDSLTVDSAQGQEAKIIIYLMTLSSDI